MRQQETTLLVARDAAAAVRDPEMPMMTLADLGVLRSVDQEPVTGSVIVTITPTYSGCPAMATIRADLYRALAEAGIHGAQVRTVLAPAWSSDWITDEGRRKLAQHNIVPPTPAPNHGAGPVPLTLEMPQYVIRCPQCGSSATEQTSSFGPTACRALHRCVECGEPFERFKEI